MTIRAPLRVVLAAAVLLVAAAGWAQEVGTIAALEGTAEIGRGGTWTPAATGAAIQQGDELRTGPEGRLRIVFQDDSVLTVSTNSHIVVDEQVFQPTQGTVRSVVQLVKGKLSALVGEYYHEPGTSYEVRTATAVAGVRGTEFDVRYDEETDVTEVIGLSGTVTVHSLVDPTGPGVLITAREATTVPRGQLPTPPRKLEEALFRQRLEGFEFVGVGRPESFIVGHPVSSGAEVPQPERAPAAGATGAPGLTEGHDASNLVGDSPAIVKALRGQLGIEF